MFSTYHGAVVHHILAEEFVITDHRALFPRISAPDSARVFIFNKCSAATADPENTIGEPLL